MNEEFALQNKKGENRVIPFVWVDGDETEISVDVTLAGEGSTVTILGIFLGTSQNFVKFNTNVIHAAPKTFSRTNLRGVFLDRSSFSNDGMVRINKGAKGADGFFTSKILLFNDARGRSVPSLEIDENDLKAGHASTVGRPDEEQLFYMKSRGIDEKEAEKLIISGFFEPILKLLSIDDRKIAAKQIGKVLQSAIQ